jgi:shikimate kinase
MLVFLIGFMGSGKSYVGKRLAEKLNYDFVDLDDYLVENEGLSITEIFEKHSENYFRERENHYLNDFLGKEKTVLATGGGAPCFFDNMKKMCANGITVYLYTSPDLLVERLSKQKDKRPLLMGKTDSELRDFILEKTKERAVYYDQAELIFEIKENSDKIIDDIFDCLTL